MTDNNSDKNDLAKCIDAIEETYEYMLAYAAQGREDDREKGVTVSKSRMFIEQAVEALSGLTAAAEESAKKNSKGSLTGYKKFLELLDRDVKKAQAVLELVLAQPALSSQLIDNLNASTHIRTLLTDLFLLDETLKKST